jgi:hypothetical protein
MTSYKSNTRNQQTNKIEIDAKDWTGKDDAEKQTISSHVR